MIKSIFKKETIKISNLGVGVSDFKLYSGNTDNEIAINLVDSNGYELEDEAKQYVKKFKEEVYRQKNKNQDINAVWFCLSIQKCKLQRVDLDTLREILRIKKNVICVLTKSDTDSTNGKVIRAYKESLNKEFPGIKILEVSIYNTSRINLNNLIKESENMIEDKALRVNFINSQRKYIDLKKKESEKSMRKYIAIAAGIGAVPIPFSDGVLLIPLQIEMISEIAKIYGVSQGATLSKAVVTDLVIGNIGRTLSGSLLKMFPGVGSIVGGAINASVASSITYALGKTISKISYNTCERILTGKDNNFLESLNKNMLSKIVAKFIKEYNTEEIKRNGEM